LRAARADGHDRAVTITRAASRSRTAAAVLAVVVLAGCSSASEGREGPQRKSHKAELLGTGVASGHPWRLTVSSGSDGKLCMAINDQLPPNTKGDVFLAAGCGFGPPDDRMSSPTDSAYAGDVGLVWGPAPAHAVRVRIDTFSLKDQQAEGSALSAQQAGHSAPVNVPGCQPSTPAHLWVAVTHRLPRWTTPGGWFFTQAVRNGCGYDNAVFYDRSGHVIAEPRW
jgi:hypothetical protein